MTGSQDIPAQKAALRSRMQESLRELPAAVRREASEQVCRRLRERTEWLGARAVLFYAPLGDELDLWPLFRERLAEGRVTALPRFRADTKDYQAAQVFDADKDMVVGRYQILEPAPACPGLALNQLDLILVPGLAFDQTGRRLSRGAGYYDRLLGLTSGRLCGVGMDLQVLPSLPVEPHDRHLDCILTPTRWITCVPGSV